MKLTKDNIGALVYDLDKILKTNDDDAIEGYVRGALRTFGFSERDTITPVDKSVKLDALKLYWTTHRRAYRLWLDYQDMSRDYYINAEIKRFRTKIEKSRTQLIYLLLDLAEAMGKVYDK